jgi:hypothetical protein
MTVLRHDSEVDARWGCEQYAGVVATVLAGARQRPEVLPSLMSSASMYAGFLAVADSDAPELDRALRVGAQAGVALFALANATIPTSVVLGTDAVVLAATGPHREAGPEAFRTAFYLAAIVRDAAGLDVLSEVPWSVLAAAGPADEAVLLGCKALQAAWLGRSEASAVVDAALTAADPATARLVPLDVLRSELVPELELLRAILFGDSRGTNRAVGRALEEHRRFRGAGESRNDPRYFLALGALGLVALAHDRGMRVEAHSDYLPLRLIQGQLDGGALSPTDEPVPFEEDDAGSITFVLCSMCGSAVARRSRSCAACATDLALAPPLTVDVEALGKLEHDRCRACREPILRFAQICPRCRTWQGAATPAPADGEDVALRPFPREYQVFVMARRREASRVAVLLPAGPPSPDEVLARVREASLPTDAAGPAVHRLAPEAPWELELAVRFEGEAVATAFAVWPVPLEALPGFDRGPLGAHVAPGDAALVIACPLGTDVLRGLHRQLIVAHAVAGNGVGLIDLASGRVRAMGWLDEAATTPAPPDPAELYAIDVVRSPDGERAWLHTRGLPRCGCFELEMLDVPAAAADRFAALLDAAARRLVEEGEAVPAEEVPFAVGADLQLAWVPSAWARGDVGVDGFGALEEQRGGFSALSAALVAVEGDGTAPIASLAPRLGSADLRASRLDDLRDKRVAAATLPRFRALRMTHADDEAWRFNVRLQAGEPAAPVWFRLDGIHGEELKVRVLGDPGGTGLLRGQQIRAPLSALLDWEIELPNGRITPDDALAEGAAQRRADLDRVRAERDRTPILPPSREGSVATVPAMDMPWPVEAVTDPGVAPPSRGLPVALSLVWPGLGHLVRGERRRAALFAGLGLVGCGVVHALAAWELWTGRRLVFVDFG